MIRPQFVVTNGIIKVHYLSENDSNASGMGTSQVNIK